MIDVKFDLECSVLGGLLFEPRLFDELQLRDEFFDDPLNRLVFGRFGVLRADGVEPDVLLVSAGLSQAGSLRVSECYSVAPLSSVATRFHARQLKALWAKQTLGLAGQVISQDADRPDVDVADLVARALDAVDSVSVSQIPLKVVYPGEFLPDYVLEMASRPPFLASCWKRLNKLIGGWRPSGFYVVAGRPGEGKTIVCLQAAFGLAQSGKHVLYFSLEMPALQLQHRLLAQVLGLDYSAIANDDLDFEVLTLGGVKWARDMVREAASLLGNNLGVVAMSRLTPQGVRAYVAAASKVRPVDAVFVDYLGLMFDDVEHRDKVARIGAISNQLKQLALELNIPVVVAQQLGREIESRPSGKPQLSDLRDSGSIEQDADVVLMIRRKHLPTDNPDGHGSDFFLVVAKNRHGQTGAARFVAQDSLSRIVEV